MAEFATEFAIQRNGQIHSYDKNLDTTNVFIPFTAFARTGNDRNNLLSTAFPF